MNKKLLAVLVLCCFLCTSLLTIMGCSNDSEPQDKGQVQASQGTDVNSSDQSEPDDAKEPLTAEKDQEQDSSDSDKEAAEQEGEQGNEDKDEKENPEENNVDEEKGTEANQNANDTEDKEDNKEELDSQKEQEKEQGVTAKTKENDEKRAAKETVDNGDADAQTSSSDKDYIKDKADDVNVAEETINFVDAYGKKQVIHKKPQRVVCLYNSFADVWYSLGGEIIGRIESTTSLPKAYLNAEVVGDMGGVNVEKLLSLEPDLVLIASNIDGQTRVIPILEQNKIEYMCLQYESVEEYLTILKLFGEIIGNQDKYQQVASKVRKDVNSVIAKVPKDKEPSVLLLFGSTRSVTVKTQFSTVGAMLKDLGARNIAYDSRLTSEQMEAFSMERVLQEDPDFIFVQTMGDDIGKILDRVRQDIESNPAWNTLTAVKEGRYIVLPKDLYLYKANIRYGDAYRGLAKILYPESF